MKRQDARTPAAKGLAEPDPELDQLASEVVHSAIEVHRQLGPGFVEPVYQRAMSVELQLRNIPFQAQAPVAVYYKGSCVGEGKLDLLVRDRLVVELKAVEALAPVHWVQVRSYLKATRCILGLLINFNVPLLRDAIKRIILTPSPGALGVLGAWPPQ